jgi:Methylamine utilisation protein MauE
VEAATRLVVGVVLLAAAAGKLRLGRALPELLAAYGIPRPLRGVAALALVTAEALVGALLLVGIRVDVAALAALALGGVFVAAVLMARARGTRRLRCGCFGAAERSWAWVLLRALGFTALAGLAAFGDELGLASPSRDTLVLAAIAVLALAVVALGVLVLALYRQVGILSMRIAPRGALEVESEGPPVGTPAPGLAGLARRGSELVAFFAEDCRLCRDLAPGVRALGREGIAVRLVYEAEENAAFARWNVPGAPFVVHVVDGVVAAKGLVNTLEQLDGLIATGHARRAHAAA